MADSGFSDYAEKAILDNIFTKFGSTLYLALLKNTGTTGSNDGNSWPDAFTGSNYLTNTTEVSTGGYARIATTTTDWAAATGTAPASKSLNTTKSWTATGAAFGEVIAWALFDASSGGNLICHGPITTAAGAATHAIVNDGDTFGFDQTNPIKLQLGDPADSF